MFPVRKVLASLCLVTAPALAVDQPLILSYDQNQHLVQIQANVHVSALLFCGPRLQPPVPFNGITVFVEPRVTVPTGDLTPGQMFELQLPGEKDGWGLQAVGIELPKFTLVASNAVIFDLRDLVERSLTARLQWKLDGYDLTVDLLTPSSAHEIVVDGVDTSYPTTKVWLRLVQPGPGEIVLPVVTPLQVVARLPMAIGVKVEIHLARETRGSPVLPVYKLVTVIDGLPNPLE